MVNPQREYKQRHPFAPMPPPEWHSLSGDVRNVEHLPGGFVKYEKRVMRDTWLNKFLWLEEWRVRLMDGDGNIVVDVKA